MQQKGDDPFDATSTDDSDRETEDDQRDTELSGHRRSSVCRCARLEQAPDRLPARSRVVVGLEHVELVALDQVLPGEEVGAEASLLDEASQALGMNPQFAGSLNQIEVVVKR